MDGWDGMRAADADRQETAERLRVALEEGRIDLHEYDERLQRAYAAKTYGELGRVVADLPGPAAAERSAVAPRQPDPAGVAEAGPTPPPTVEAPEPGRRGWLLGIWLPWLRVAAILNAVWVLSCLGRQDLVYYWPLWALGPWGAVLLMRSVGALGSHSDTDRRKRCRAVGPAGPHHDVHRRPRGRTRRRAGGW